MPKYDFKCIKCQQVTDPFFPIQDGPPPAIICECGGEAFRVHTVPAVAFKGSGWGSSK